MPPKIKKPKSWKGTGSTHIRHGSYGGSRRYRGMLDEASEIDVKPKKKKKKQRTRITY